MIGTFHSACSIHIPNFKSIRQSVLELSSGKIGKPLGFELKPIKIMVNLYLTEPNIDRDLPLTMLHPHTKFHVNQLKRSRVIGQKLQHPQGFEHKPIKIKVNLYPTEPNIDRDLPLTMLHPHTKFQVELSRCSRAGFRTQTYQNNGQLVSN